MPAQQHARPSWLYTGKAAETPVRSNAAIQQRWRRRRKKKTFSRTILNSNVLCVDDLFQSFELTRTELGFRRLGCVERLLLLARNDHKCISVVVTRICKSNCHIMRQTEEARRSACDFVLSSTFLELLQELGVEDSLGSLDGVLQNARTRFRTNPGFETMPGMPGGCAGWAGCAPGG
jgi:hypothetical protein